MRNILIIVAALMLELGVLHAEELSKSQAFNEGISEFTEKAIGTQSLHVGSLRDTSCGRNPLVNQDANNAAFAACVMYVLGAVDMIREWQKIDPVHALPVCVPQTITAGGLIIAIQEYIEATAPWQHQQTDAATSVLAALRAKWPCPHPQLADPFEEGVAAWNRRDYASALQLFRPLAERGNIRAEALLGFSYESGLGVPQDYVEAAKWYRRAADTGDDIAQYNIGIMHQNGQGVPRDLVMAYMWLDLAAMRGHRGAAMDRDRLAESMTAAQITEAQELARKWKPKSR
jgi:uncharacterized protein